MLLRRERDRPMLLLAYGLLLAAALSHFLMAIPLIAACALLLGWIPVRDGSWRDRVIPLTIVGSVTALSTLFWLGFAWFQAPGLTAGASVLEVVRPVVVAMLKFPNVLDTVVYPWARTLPVLSILFALAFLRAFVVGLTDRSAAADLRVWCLAALVVVGVTATAPVKYHEIRYSFVLLPLGYLLLACLIALCLQGLVRAPRARAAVQLMLVPALMAVSDDHHYDHLLRVDSADYNFRLHLPDAKTAMYYTRLDYRTPASFINRHLGDGDRVVIFPSAAQPYVARLDAIFRDPAALEFPEISCRAGTVERWTNAPMIKSSDELADFIRETAGATWIVVSDAQWQRYGRVPESHRLERCASGIDGAVLTLRVHDRRSPGSGTKR